MISTKGRYAVRVMIDLAENGKERAIPLKDIAARQEISKKYLEIIMKDMVAGGLVKGTSGKEYTLDEILETMEGPLSPVACLAGENNVCPRKDQCQTLPLWTEFDTLVHNFLHGKHLSDLVRK